MSSSKILIPVFVFFAMLGGALVTQSWEGITYVYTGESERRLPAAIGKGMDFTQLEGDALFLSSQKRLIEEARLIKEEAAIGIELGHFLTRDHLGRKQFACDKYSKIVIKFQAIGIAENSESPIMEIEADCVIGKRASKIEPIWIPLDHLKKEKPGNMEIKINEPHSLDFRFDHIGSAWPEKWELNSVKLLSQKSGEEIFINHSQIRELIEKPLEFIW